MASFRPIVLCSAALAATALALPRAAHACEPDPCSESNRIKGFDPPAGVIATDGVLAFRFARQGSAIDDTQALAYVQVEVTDEQGTPVAGALEMIEPWRLALWRPAAPLAPGATYQVSVLVDNDALALAHDDPFLADFSCGDNIGYDVAVVAGAALPLVSAPESTPTSNHETNEILALDTIVCCDGAIPQMENMCGWADVYWNEGICAAAAGHGWLEAGFSIDVAALTPEVAADLAFELVGDGVSQAAAPGSEQVTWRGDAPVCLHLEVTSLATGQSVATTETCFGDDFAAELGILDIDPAAGLAACVGEPYTCAVLGDEWSGSWDPAACEPWGGGGSSGEAGSDSAGSDSAGSDSGPLDGGSWGDEGTADGGSNDGSGSGGEDIADRGCACGSQPRRGALGLLAIAAIAIRRRTPARDR